MNREPLFSHMMEGSGQGGHRRINYIYKKKKNLFVFHFASTCIKQTPKQTRLMNTQISNKKSLPRDSSEEQQQQEGLNIVHTVETHGQSDGAELRLKIGFVQPLDSRKSGLVLSQRAALSGKQLRNKNLHAANSPPDVLVEVWVVSLGKKVANIGCIFWTDKTRMEHIRIFF